MREIGADTATAIVEAFHAAVMERKHAIESGPLCS
jgi:hypothetical protein